MKSLVKKLQQSNHKQRIAIMKAVSKRTGPQEPGTWRRSFSFGVSNTSKEADKEVH